MQQYEQQVLAGVLVIAKGINIHVEHDNIFSYFPLKFPENSLFYKLCTCLNSPFYNLLVWHLLECLVLKVSYCWGFLPLRIGGVHDHCPKKAKYTDTIFNVVRQIAYIHGSSLYY
jgi:hypothetical protein